MPETEDVMTEKIERDIAFNLDQERWVIHQKAVIAMAALAVICDGFDNQVLGFAIPTMSKAWQIAPANFALVPAVGLVGMIIGTGIGGLLGDRIGRRRALIGSVAIFGVFTMTTAAASGLVSLVVLRFLTGLGLGGAMPNAAVIAVEVSPVRNRPLSVTLTIVCVPIGGLIGGIMAVQILPGLGWEFLFAAAGIAPLLLAKAMIAYLPESPGFLKRVENRRDELRISYVKMGYDVRTAEQIPVAESPTIAQSRILDLFAASLRRDTIAVWCAFFMCLLTVYLMFNWAPAILSAAGFNSRMSSFGLAGFNLGGVGGAILGAWAIRRNGSRRAMFALCALAIAVTLFIASIGLSGLSNNSLLSLLSVFGLAVNGVQIALFALVSHLYESGIRATGVGSAVAFGRMGAIASSYVGAAVLTGSSGDRIFCAMAFSMSATFLALACVKKHIPRDVEL